MNNRLVNWLIFFSVSFIWGSSFILMKEGLKNLSAFEVASIRIVTSGLVLFPVFISSLTEIARKKLGLVFLSGLLGSFFPAYLFCIAEGSVDSALAGTLNSLTPVFVLFTGMVFWRTQISGNMILGVAVAFLGSILLFFSQKNIIHHSNLLHVFLIILASFCYGLNVNLVQRYLSGIPSLKIVSMALFFCAIPAFFILFFSGFFKRELLNHEILSSIGYASLLGLGGTRNVWS
ncbi:MAG: DMT family transporter [Ferruginibacter sp.]|nr:DMT family transporter [Ferruginibacter sp.]